MILAWANPFNIYNHLKDFETSNAKVAAPIFFIYLAPLPFFIGCCFAAYNIYVFIGEQPTWQPINNS